MRIEIQRSVVMVGALLAMASLPIISILLAALPDRTQADEREGLRRGLQLAALWMAMVIGSGWVQVALAR